MAKRLAYAYRVLGIEAVASPKAALRNCRRDVQRRLKVLSAANEASAGERVAKDFLLRRCRNCGDCWLARL